MAYFIRHPQKKMILISFILTLIFACGNTIAQSAQNLENASLRSLPMLHLKHTLAESLLHNASAVLACSKYYKTRAGIWRRIRRERIAGKHSSRWLLQHSYYYPDVKIKWENL